jgi:hypothetical protein
MKIVALNERFAMKTFVDYVAANDAYKTKPVRENNLLMFLNFSFIFT